MIASVWNLNLNDFKMLKIRDDYSIHKIVYDLFDKTRTDVQERASEASGILYADKGSNFNHKQILIVSDRSPANPRCGTIESRKIKASFLEHNIYKFEVIINPTKRDKKTGKTISIIVKPRTPYEPNARQQVQEWFCKKAVNWGFEVDNTSLVVNAIDVIRFEKEANNIAKPT